MSRGTSGAGGGSGVEHARRAGAKAPASLLRRARAIVTLAVALGSRRAKRETMAFVVAVVGATGAVGREMLRTLEARRFPVRRLLALASPKSAGKKLPFAGGE